MVKFIEEGHLYLSTDGTPFDWISVTTLVHQFVEEFDGPAVAERCSKGKNPKYKGKDPKDILAMWTKESKRSTDLGTWYHNQREADVLSRTSITRDGIELPIVNSILEDGEKIAPIQAISEGVYPEHFVYLKSASVCGQVDHLEVVGNTINISDYKTNKEVKTRGYEFWDGSRKMMLGPVKHLEDCEFNHYALQLSIYMYITHKHNYNLEPGFMEIHHIEFEVESEDINGYPIHSLGPSGEPIVKSITPIRLPYLKKEVLAMLKWLKVNKKIVLHNAH